MDTTKLNIIAEKRARQCFAIAKKKLKISLPFKRVVFFEKNTDAGYVMPDIDTTIYLNLPLFKKHKKYFEHETIPHEVAHLFAHKINKIKKRKEGFHGKTWKYVMNEVFNIEAKRCHELDTSGIGRYKARKYKYICKCQKHKISEKIHKKIQSKESTYRCKDCLSQLVFLCEM